MIVPRPKTFPSLTGKKACRRLGLIPSESPPIVVDTSLLDRVLDFSERDPNLEVGGFLLGGFCHDRAIGQEFIELSDYVPATHVESRFRSLTFTHESWASLHRQLESRFPNRRVMGWHHTHPGFGIFLSRQDEFIHRNFFAQPWQVALVVDPRRGELGFFQWKDDQIVNAGFLIQSEGRRREHSRKRNV